jgi:hypothetical protein
MLPTSQSKPREADRGERMASLRAMRRIVLPILCCLIVLLAGCGVQNTVSGFPSGVNRPQPVTQTFHGCPPGGDGGDQALNMLKNRVDDGDNGRYYDADLASILALPIPEGVERVARSDWSPDDLSQVQQYEGTPVRVVGWIYGDRHEGTESTNCHSTDYRDFHVWVVPDSGDDRTQAIVAEVTPRVRALRAGWTDDALSGLSGRQVRISGWALMDQEHPEQLGQTRGTLWEVHPILHIEVNSGGSWQSIDAS